ncbi:MAG TPA: PVC-type heme-binding CxxCH protein, partial [Candidatus Limnocylindria bacterium]|nr:PVC-type heme-binding CxxCH protein [Candidatus Limnocylindria bacterium]
RLWVAEGYTYPKRKGAPPKIDTNTTATPTKEQLADIFGSNDRILVFEDTDGDGKHDKRTVFLDKLNLVSGIEVGFGGVFIGAAPYLMFVPVKDWDNPAPAGDPQILLDGWDYARDTHETLNTFHWGPDGWLYGVHGVFCPSNVGKPGTPVAQRQWVDAAVWRYHPTKHQFEVFAEGTSNPWGFDFDENGQLIEEACVIPHLFHMIQGGRYQRQGGAHYAVGPDETQRFAAKKEGKSDKTLNPYIYDDIKTIADHAHFRGGQWTDKDRLASDDLGGGHAHAGMLIYQGDSFPAEYRGKMFMNNIHGARINMDIPERKGSGFVGKHGADFLKFNDKWSQVVDLRAGPDGSIYMIDWYDKNQCHLNTPESHDRSNGRIYKVSYGDRKAEKVDLATLNDGALMMLMVSKNAWQARHAQRILQERGAKGDFNAAHALPFLGMKQPVDFHRAFQPTPTDQLRMLWILGACGKLSQEASEKLLENTNEYVRAWTIQLACEDKKPSDDLLKDLALMAREDKSPVVRLYLASALQRLPLAQRGEILEGLLAHAEDAKDHNLPLMYWYAAEPLAGQDVATAAKLLSKTKIPQVREYITRRMTAK